MSVVRAHDRTYWQALAESRLPPKDQIVARNAAITATYARWYVQRPDLLKWAGMAAFASHRVGLALLPFRFHVLDDVIDSVSKMFKGITGSHSVLQDLGLIRDTNNMVFHDIGWAHVAYMTPEGGIEAVEACAGGDPDSSLLVEGFRTIDRGRRMLEGQQQRDEGMRLVWAGNQLLLQQEQERIVQRQFEQCDVDLRIFLTVATIMNFSSNYVDPDLDESTSFPEFISTQGRALLQKLKQGPNITCWEQRWYWVENAVLPLWKKVEASDKRLNQKLAFLMEGART